MVNRDAVRESVLKEAQEIFTKYGYAKTTMDDIARAMGKGKSSIYYYYKSKDEIFRAVVEHELNELRSKIMSAVDAAAGPREKLKAYVLQRMHGLGNMVNLYNVLRTEFVSQREFTDSVRMQTDNEEIRIIKDILDEGVSNGTFHLDDTYLTAIAMVTAMKGLEVPMVVSNQDSQLEIRLDRLLEVLFFGILKR